jgi:hypothetical protein
MSPPQGATGWRPRASAPLPGPERKAPEDNSAEERWKAFYRKIDVKGDIQPFQNQEDVDNWGAGLSDEETQKLLGRLKSMYYEYSLPQAMQSILEDVFYMVQTARWHLKQDGNSEEWRAWIAVHMYAFYTALRHAAEMAAEIEKNTGFSGREISEA